MILLSLICLVNWIGFILWKKMQNWHFKLKSYHSSDSINFYQRSQVSTIYLLRSSSRNKIRNIGSKRYKESSNNGQDNKFHTSLVGRMGLEATQIIIDSFALFENRLTFIVRPALVVASFLLKSVFFDLGTARLKWF